MKHVRCKCGARNVWSITNWFPKDCDGCSVCGTTLVDNEHEHKATLPHKWKQVLDKTTGEHIRDVCTECFVTITNYSQKH